MALLCFAEFAGSMHRTLREDFDWWQASKDTKTVSREPEEVRSELAKLDEQVGRITTLRNATARSAEAFHEVKSELGRLRGQQSL